MITLEEYWVKFKEICDNILEELKSFEKTKDRRDWIKKKHDVLIAQLNKEYLELLKIEENDLQNL